MFQIQVDLKLQWIITIANRDITLLTILTETEYMVLRAWETLKILCQVTAGIKSYSKKRTKKRLLFIMIMSRGFDDSAKCFTSNIK